MTEIQYNNRRRGGDDTVAESAKSAKQMIGEALKNHRHKKKLTQAQLANLSGLSRSYIADMENGRYCPSVDALAKLSSLLDLDLNFLTAK